MFDPKKSLSPATHPSYRPDIDGLRAVAVLAVVFFHAFPKYLQGGFVGVDIFFIISGFLISTIIFQSLQHDSFRFSDFYGRRIRRIFPSLIVVMVGCLVLGWFVLLSGEYKQLGKHVAGGAGFISNLVLLSESGYFDNSAATKPLLHLWSLGIEEQYYILWPFILFVAWKKKWSMALTTSTILVASFLANIGMVKDAPVKAFYWPITRFWELLMGSLLAYGVLKNTYFSRKISPTARDILSLLGAALLVLSMTITTEHDAFPGWWAVLPTTGAVLIIMAGSQSIFNRVVLSNKWFVWIGLFSYPLYLWHWPLLTFLRIIECDTLSPLVSISAVIASFVFAWSTYSFVEKPIRYGYSMKKKTYGLLFIMMLVCCTGIYSYYRDGYTFRAVNKNMKIADFDITTNYRRGTCFRDFNGAEPIYFPEQCSGREEGIHKPLVILWGDSHAASLYQGLLEQSEIFGFSLSQYNLGGCPPALGFNSKSRPYCSRANNYVLDKILSATPDLIILAASWALYNGDHPNMGFLQDSELKETIRKLQQKSTAQIMLVGPLPVFLNNQQKIGRNVFNAKGITRSYRAFCYDVIAIDRHIEELSKALGVNYFSPIDILCNEDGCLMSTSTDVFTPLAWDESHLTNAGSCYVIREAVRNNRLWLPGGHSHTALIRGELGNLR